MKWKRHCNIDLKKKSRGSVVEQSLIVAMIVVAAIAGLGYLGLAVQKQLGVLAGATKNELTKDGFTFSSVYYTCNDLMQRFMEQHPVLNKESAMELYNMWRNEIMIPYGDVLSEDELDVLVRSSIDIFDPSSYGGAYILEDGDAERIYKSEKQKVLDAWQNRTLRRGYGIGTDELKYYLHILEIVGAALGLPYNTYNYWR